VTDCAAFETRLREFSFGDKAWRAWLREQQGVEDCIADGLRRTREQEDWLGFELYVIAAQAHPSRAYTQTLCEVLSEQRDGLDSEGIVDALDPLKDPAAIPALRRTVRWIPDWDEFGQMARKAVWALFSIKTPEALDAIRAEVTPDLPFKVVEAAQEALGDSEVSSTERS
jgi:HEAT repeat protein